MVCAKCNSVIGDHCRICTACGADVGFPNVRAAQNVQELSALQTRWETANEFARKTGAEAALHHFEVLLKRSKAVMCRSWGIVDRIVSADSQVFATFYLEVEAGLRTPENNEMDRIRAAVDATFFPFYSAEVRFAALTLDGRGPSAYGPCSIILKESMIADRATVFEENTVIFCRRRGIPLGAKIPTGHRAKWEDRHRLGIAKLHEKIASDMTEESFGQLLLQQHPSTEDTELIEVHIYGPINRQAIEAVGGQQPKTEEDRVIVASIERKLAQIGVPLVVFP